MKQLILLFALVPVFCYSQSKDQAKEKVWSLLERNNPDGHFFMTQLYEMPTKFKLGNSTLSVSKPSDFMVYINDYSQEGILSQMSTAVHEACHMYQGKKTYALIDEGDLPYEFGTSYTVYYLNSNEEYLVKETPTFPSIRIASLVPKELKSSRYDTYINSRNKILGTQQSGVYGLMEEWSAYYNGFRTTLLNFPEYSAKAKNDPAYYLNFLSDAGSTRISYNEFKYFILEYLLYASKKEKKIFKEIMVNADFKKAYQAIDQSFKSAVSDYLDRLEEINMTVTKAGLDYRVDGDYIWIGFKGVGAFTTENEAFEAAILDPKYASILEELAKN